MKFSVATLAAFVAIVVAADADPFINTPVSATTCQTTSLTFGGTHPPWVISAIPGGQAGATPIEDIVTTSTSPYAWLVNLAEGTYITMQIRDSQGNLQYSAPVTILGGTDTSCVGTNTTGTTVTNSATTTAGGVTTTTAIVTGTTTTGASTTGTGSATITTTTKAGSTTSGASSTTASHTTSTSGAASHLDAKMGLAGLLGLVGAALAI